MKGVLFILTICSLAGVGSATCDGRKCKEYCNGAGCAQNCTGNYCGQVCIGNSCAKGCDGDFCGLSCVGKGCAVDCQGAFCGSSCFHFKDEKCSNKQGTKTYTMGGECSADDTQPLSFCEHKNHPALWQALKDTETNGDPITLPTGDIKQCFYNGAACVDTVDNFPPLVCNHFLFCKNDDGDISEDAKCTDTEKCGVCQGICENDSECKGNLKCFVRNGNETVPGCSSSTSASYKNVQRLNVPGVGYCIDADTSTTDSSTLNDGEIAAIAIGALVLSAAVGALVWRCKKTKRGFFGSSSGSMAEPIKF